MNWVLGVQRLFLQLRSSCTVVGRVRIGEEAACFMYSSVCVQRLWKAVESLRIFELQTSGIRDGHHCHDCAVVLLRLLTVRCQKVYKVRASNDLKCRLVAWRQWRYACCSLHDAAWAPNCEACWVLAARSQRQTLRTPLCWQLDTGSRICVKGYTFCVSTGSTGADMQIQDRQCTYNVTSRCVRVTTVAVKSNKYYIVWVCVCSLSYPTCKAHAPYYIVICDLSGSTIFFHIIS